MLRRFLQIAIIIMVIPINIFAQNVAISDDDAYTADPSAMLDVKAINKGLLVPRVTTTQKNAISSPATGLLVFDTDLNEFCYYDGSSWIVLLKDHIDNIHDANNDTKITTEQAANEDTIRFFLGGTEKYKFGNKNFSFENSLDNINIGRFAGNNISSGNNNIFIGYKAGNSNADGQYNLFAGSEAGKSNIGGISYYDFGSYNTFLGYKSGSYNTYGFYNTYIGAYTGAGNSSTPGADGYYNVFIGYMAGRYEQGIGKLCINSYTGGSLVPLIYGEFVGAPWNKRCVVIDGDSLSNGNDRTFFVNGDAGGMTTWWNDSDKRLKKNISTIDNALGKVLKLRGVNYEWKDAEKRGAGLQMGFIAQEVEKVVPEVVDKKNDHYQMTYSSLTALLVEAMKEQQNIIDSLKADNIKLKEDNASIKSEIGKIKETLNASAKGE